METNHTMVPAQSHGFAAVGSALLHLGCQFCPLPTGEVKRFLPSFDQRRPHVGGPVKAVSTPQMKKSSNLYLA